MPHFEAWEGSRTSWFESAWTALTSPVVRGAGVRRTGDLVAEPAEAVITQPSPA